MATMRSYPMGALPPDEFAWQIGKTAASICYVDQAENILSTQHHDERTRAFLYEKVVRVRSGEEAVPDFMTDDQILAEAGQ